LEKAGRISEYRSAFSAICDSVAIRKIATGGKWRTPANSELPLTRL